MDYASFAPQGDRDIMLQAIKDGECWDSCLSTISGTPLQNDREFMLGALEFSGELALPYASPSLKNHRVVVLKDVKFDGEMLQYTSAALQDNRDIVLQTIRWNAVLLRYASGDVLRSIDASALIFH